jgi:hypothetical protein
MADEEKPDSEVDASEDESEQALLPKSFFAGKDLEIGSKCEVKIEGIYEDEIAVSYVPHKKDKDGKEKSNSSDDDESMDGAMKRMDSMAEPMTGPPPMQGGY